MERKEQEIKLIVDRDDESGFWYFVVKLSGDVIHFRPGFREKAEAQRIGDLWVREHFQVE